MKNNRLLLLLLAGCGILASSCKKDKQEDPTPTPSSGYTVPTTYSFTTVNYSGQTVRLNMLTEMKNYMATANTQGTVISATTLKNMFSNTGAPFADSTLNNSGKQLKSKCFILDQTYFETLMDDMAAASTSVVNGSNGTAGVVVSSTNPSKKYLQSANGFEYNQIIQKGLMGAVFYYQAMESYLCTAGVGSGVDNSTVVAGEGTAMEHHWDEGFGYFGAPVDFPTNTTGLLYWSSYCNQVNGVLANATPLMNAFIKGRAAISNSDYTTRDAQMAIVRTEWERLVAAAAIHEMNAAKANLSDDALRNHYLSEAYGFVLSLKYKSDKLITQTQIDNILNNYLGSNFYTITQVNIDNAINEISTIYGMDSIKATL
jgi:hypothetical protein